MAGPVGRAPIDGAETGPGKPLVFGPAPSRRGLLCGIAVIAAELALDASLYWMVAGAPRGTYIRPMMHAAMFFMVAIAGLVVGVPLCIADAVAAISARSRPRLVQAILGLILVVAALPVGVGVLNLMVRMLGLHLSD